MKKNASISFDTDFVYSISKEENRLINLKNAVQEGVNSGRAENFDPNKHLESLKAKRKAND